MIGPAPPPQRAGRGLARPYSEASEAAERPPCVRELHASCILSCCRGLDRMQTSGLAVACFLPDASCSVYFVSVRNVQSIFVSVIVLLLDVFYLNQLDAFYLNQATSLTGCWLVSEGAIVSAEGDWAILRQFLSASRPGGWPYFDGCR